MAKPDNLYRAFALAGPADRPALHDPTGRSWTFAALDQASAAAAAGLAAAGCEPGDRVLLQASASADWLIAYLACLRSGFVVVPVSTDYAGDELEHFLVDAAPRVAVADAPRRPALALAAGARAPVIDLASLPSADAGAPPPVAAGGDELAALLYSSGTTGRPKGAELSHANLLANARTLVAAWGFTAADRLLHALPLHHAHGLFVAVGTAWIAGASIALRPRFDPADIVAQLPGCSVFMGVPTHYARLLAEPGLAAASAGVRLFVSGSAPLAATLHARFAALTGHPVLERYGMTETLMIASNPLRGDRRPGSVGHPLAGVELRITGADDTALPAGATGEIQVRGPSVTRGYRGAPDKTAASFTADGWFRTGDLGVVADDGYVTIVGRSKDLVITGGLNVYPREVERVIDELPGVVESAVIGIPHADFGEAVVAIVVTATATNLSPSAVRDAVRGRLAGYKTPKQVFFVPELPRNALGKVRKAELRARFAGAFADVRSRSQPPGDPA